MLTGQGAGPVKSNLGAHMSSPRPTVDSTAVVHRLPLRGERLYVRPRANPMPRRPLTWGPAADSGGQWLPWHARSRAAAAAAKG